MTKILEWTVLNKPKLIGEVRQIVWGDMIEKNCFKGTNLVLHFYIVNQRMSPITIKRYALKAKLGGQWRFAKWIHIPKGFRMPGFPYIDFASADLYERTSLNLLEYGKGVSGWLCFLFEAEKQSDIRNSDLQLEMIDAFDRKHVIKINPRSQAQMATPESPGTRQYFPGMGINS